MRSKCLTIAFSPSVCRFLIVGHVIEEPNIPAPICPIFRLKLDQLFVVLRQSFDQGKAVAHFDGETSRWKIVRLQLQAAFDQVDCGSYPIALEVEKERQIEICLSVVGVCLNVLFQLGNSAVEID